MEKIETKRTPSIHIPAFKIESTDFIKIIEDIHNNSGNISLTTGERAYDEIQYKYETIDEIKDHLPLITNPLELNIDGMNLTLNSWSDNIQLEYNEENSHRAKSFVKQLSFYKPWYRLLATELFSMIVNVLLTLITLALLYKNNSESFLENIYIIIPLDIVGVVLFVSLALHTINSALETTKAVIFYAPRETFWQRNRDTIIVGVIVAVITATMTLGIPVLIKNNKTSSDENDPIIQKQDN